MSPVGGRCDNQRVSDVSIYDRIGEEGFERFVKAFYRRIPEDDILGPMYPAHDLVGAEERLRDFLIFRFGGPGRYIEQRGHPRLRMRHARFAVDKAARDRWMELMTAALEEAELPEDASKELREFFDGVATFLINRDPSASPFQFHG
ncbi:MAG: globin [Acidobacteria bacterium]|nr:globin [Acidobacteriota bacterium]